MISRLVLVTLMTGLFAGIPNALAQDQDNREALAARFIELARLDEVMEQIKGGLVAGMQASMQRAIQEGRVDASGGKLQKITAIVEEELQASLDEMLPEAEIVLTSFYAERLTEAELSELVEIYQRPVLGKMFELAPDLNQQMIALAIEHQKNSEGRLLQRLKELDE